MLKIAISGAAGRMGARLIVLGHSDPDISIVSAIEANDHPKLGQDSGLSSGIDQNSVPFQSSFPEDLDVVIDFSHPPGAEAAVNHCLHWKTPLVMATTGLTDSTIALMQKGSEEIPIVWAPSMSLAVNLSMKMVEMAGQALKNHASGVDVEIIERHHRYKADSPSGTALKFGEIVGQAMGIDQHVHGREGMVGERPRNEIGYHAV
ncbi:MAG: 4-hydroxy-tetrahydrodipicolinate reductase, partial [Planctomycetota bacterium]